MTKEEVIEILERFVLGAKPCSQREIVDACASAYRMLKEQPSLPSVLDEAAEFDKMFEDFCDQHPDGLTLNECAEFFYDKGKQAGAEWMAGQGVTKEAVIGMATEEIFINVSQQTLNELNLCPGDKVVVQIRKK